jgi:flagellar assembly protein FliH
MISLSSIVKAKYHSISDERKDLTADEVFLHEAEKEAQLMIEDVINEIEAMKQEAEEDAAEIIEKASEEGNVIRFKAEQQGYQEGYNRGLLDGTAKARKRAEEGLAEIDEMIKALKEERVNIRKKHESDILLIAFELAKKIMKQQILVEEDAVLSMLEEILYEQEQANEAGVKIYLSEYSKTLDAAMDKNIANKVRNKIKNARVIMIKGNDTIMIESENGVIDASLPLQIKQLQDAMNMS